MLSKSRGHVLRVATVLHLLFHIDDYDEVLNPVVSEAALKAAVNFIQVASQQTAFIAGRSALNDELDKFKAGKFSTYTCTKMYTPDMKTQHKQSPQNGQ